MGMTFYGFAFYGFAFQIDWHFISGYPQCVSRDQRQLLSRQRVAARYDIDAVVARDGSTAEQMWLTLFDRVNEKWCKQFGWPEPMSKGLVRIMP
jgi:hypothetical protein